MTKPFNGVINLDIRNSTPDWEPYEQPKAPDGAPNVMFIVWDDTGFGALEPFGGPIEMPTMQRLVRRRAEYTQFHTTAICSSTRASLLTGRNHTTVGMACIAEADDAAFPARTGTCRSRRRRSPRCSASGATTRTRSASGTSSPRTRRTWHRRSATGRPAAASSASTGTSAARRTSGTPTSCRTSSSSTSPLTRRRTGRPGFGDDDYHLSRDLVDRAIAMIADAKQIAPDRPFFMYFCPGAGPRAASLAEGVGRQVQGPLRRGVRRDPREHPRPIRRSSGLLPENTELSPINPLVGEKSVDGIEQSPRRRRAAVGLAARRREDPHAPHGRGVRRVLQLHRPRDRPADRLPRAERGARQHVDRPRSPTTAPRVKAARTVRSTRTRS